MHICIKLQVSDKNFLIEQFGEIESSKIEIRKNWVSLNNVNKLNSFEERYRKRLFVLEELKIKKIIKQL